MMFWTSRTKTKVACIETFDSKWASEKQWQFMSSLVEQLTQPQIQTLLAFDFTTAQEIFTPPIQDNFNLYEQVHNLLYSTINILSIQPTIKHLAFLSPSFLSYDSYNKKWVYNDGNQYVTFVPGFIPKKNNREISVSKLKAIMERERREEFCNK